MFFIFAWIMFTILVGVAASSRGRSVLGWVVGSLFISPFFALLFILIMGHNKVDTQTV
jgi:choline-glycine betaine transporter